MTRKSAVLDVPEGADGAAPPARGAADEDQEGGLPPRVPSFTHSPPLTSQLGPEQTESETLVLPFWTRIKAAVL